MFKNIYRNKNIEHFLRIKSPLIDIPDKYFRWWSNVQVICWIPLSIRTLIRHLIQGYVQRLLKTWKSMDYLSKNIDYPLKVDIINSAKPKPLYILYFLLQHVLPRLHRHSSSQFFPHCPFLPISRISSSHRWGCPSLLPISGICSSYWWYSHWSMLEQSL